MGERSACEPRLGHGAGSRHPTFDYAELARLLREDDRPATSIAPNLGVQHMHFGARPAPSATGPRGCTFVCLKETPLAYKKHHGLGVRRGCDHG